MDHSIEKIALNLSLDSVGIWRPTCEADDSNLSYPDDGNEASFQIEDNSFWFQHRSDCISDVMKNFPPQGPIFDVGGGNGYVSLSIADAGFESVLVEPGPSGAMKGKKRGITHVVCSTIENAGFKDQSLPAIGLFDVLEHIEDDKAFLSSLRPKLAHNGLLYLTVPAHRFLWSIEDDHGGHFHRYSLSKLKNSMASAGFDVFYASYFFSALPLPIFLFRSIPSRLGMIKDTDVSRVADEHREKPGLLGSLLNSILASERKTIQRKKQIPLGASIILVATPGSE